MSIKNWNAATGSFMVSLNWSSLDTPVAGDNLYLQSGTAVLAHRTLGLATALTTIGLIGATAASAPVLVLQDVTLKNVKLSEAPPHYQGPVGGSPPGYYAPKFGTIWIKGTVTNDGGMIEGGRDSLGPATDLKILLNPGAALINKGTLAAFPGGQLTISGSGAARVENDGSINALGGKVMIATHLAGVGSTSTSNSGGGGYSGSVEVNAAVDAGQTFHISQGSLQIDQPLKFLGKVDLGVPQLAGAVRLEGLNAASWDVKGSLLELFNAAGAVIGTLQFTTLQSQATLVVSNLPDPSYGHAVSITASHPSGPASTSLSVLPYHGR